MGRLYHPGPCCCGGFNPCLNRVLPSTLYFCFYREDQDTGAILPAFSFGCSAGGASCTQDDQAECESYFSGRSFALDRFQGAPGHPEPWIWRIRPGQTPAWVVLDPFAPANDSLFIVEGVAPPGGGSYDPLACVGGVRFCPVCHECMSGEFCGSQVLVRQVSTITPFYLVCRGNNARGGANANECSNVVVISESPACVAPVLPDRWYCWRDFSGPISPPTLACSKTSPGASWAVVGGPYFSCEDCQAVCVSLGLTPCV